jgi:hypothetical protein
MSPFSLDKEQQALCLQATRLTLLTDLLDVRTRRLAHVTDCLADPAFQATVQPDEMAMLQSHQAALQEIIALVERRRTETKILVANQKQAPPPIVIQVSRLRRHLAWRWGR